MIVWIGGFVLKAQVPTGAAVGRVVDADVLRARANAQIRKDVAFSFVYRGNLTASEVQVLNLPFATSVCAYIEGGRGIVFGLANPADVSAGKSGSCTPA